MLQELVAYMLALVTARREHPGDDLLSGLIHEEEQGDRLSESELFSMLSLLIIAGHETTVTFIGSAVLVLIQNPSQLQVLLQKPDLLPAAVEELLRYDSPVARATIRWVAQDIELAGQQLRRGELIIVIPASAHRDELRFENPAELDLERGPNPHLVFGKGVHYCLGTWLARLEGEIALQALFQRFPGLRLGIPAAELQWRKVPMLHSLEHLPLRWD